MKLTFQANTPDVSIHRLLIRQSPARRFLFDPSGSESAKNNFNLAESQSRIDRLTEKTHFLLSRLSPKLSETRGTYSPNLPNLNRYTIHQYKDGRPVEFTLNGPQGIERQAGQVLERTLRQIVKYKQNPFPDLDPAQPLIAAHPHLTNTWTIGNRIGLTQTVNGNYFLSYLNPADKSRLQVMINPSAGHHTVTLKYLPPQSGEHQNGLEQTIELKPEDPLSNALSGYPNRIHNYYRVDKARREGITLNTITNGRPTVNSFGFQTEAQSDDTRRTMGFRFPEGTNPRKAD